MRVHISAHACRRCQDRGFTLEQVLECLDVGTMELLPYGNRLYKLRRLVVVTAGEALHVVTVFRHDPKRRAKEKRQRLRRFYREIRHAPNR